MKTLKLMEVMLPETWSGNEWVFTFNAEDDGAVVPDEDFQEYLDKYSRRLNQRWCLGEYYFCECCHTVHKRDNMVKVKYDYGEDDYYFLCEECYNDASDNSEVVVCEDCGCVWVNDEHMYWLDNLEKAVCGVCEENYSQCCYCNDWYPTDDLTYINGRDEYACEHCRDNGSWDWCDNCDDAFDEDDLHYTDDGRYCQSCYDDVANYATGVVDYYASHSFENQLDPKVCDGEDEDDTRCCGIEIEYQHDDGTDSAHDLFDLFDSAHLIGVVKVTLDGTVAGEVVTAPLSLNWLYQEHCPLETALEIMKKHGCRAWKTLLVGGHIHISDYGMHREEKSFLAKLVNACSDFFRVISGRQHSEGAFDYCQFRKPYDNGAVLAEHGCAVNIETHYTTVEFRFWGGTLNFKSIRSRAVLCYYLVEFCIEWCNNHNWDTEFPHPDGDDPNGYGCREYVAKYYDILLGFFKSLVCLPHGEEVIDYCADRVRRDRDNWFCQNESQPLFNYFLK